MGDGPDKNKIKFEPAKKEMYSNDITHAVFASNNKPVMTNIQSFTNYETQRVTTNSQYEGNLNNTNGSYAIDYKDVPLTTLRQLMINGNTITSVNSQQQANYVFSNDSVLPITNRQTTSNIPVTNVRGEEKQVRLLQQDDAKMTLRPSTNYNNISNIVPNNTANYIELSDKPRNTIKETTIYNTPEINIKGMYNDTYSTLQDNAKPTIKETTIISNRPNGNPTLITAVYVKNNDTAKNTHRQTTENTQYVGHNHDQICESTYIKNNDTAKNTHRQTTENNQYIGHVNSNSIEAPYTRDQHFEAKPTIKQTTLQSTPGGRLNYTPNGNYARDINDKAKVTIKQTTLLTDYTGGLHGEVDAQISHEASNNMSIDDRREISTFNRTPNGKGDINGPYIDRDNVRMNDRRDIYNYVSHPHKSLDMSVMPTVSHDVIINQYVKPIVDVSTYYINPNFINTLKNNPLVNDIYHQKNV